MLALDNSGNCFTACSMDYSPNTKNFMARLPMPALAPAAFIVDNGYQFVEQASVTYSGPMYGRTNGYNGMAVNSNFLVTWDGSVLKKWDKNTGAKLDTLLINPAPYQCGGLELDNCDNIYVGVNKSFRIYDANFQLLSTTTLPDSVYDLKLGPGNILFTCGKTFASSHQLASPSCVPLAVTSTITCTSSAATATASGGMPPFTYVWNTIPPQSTQIATGLLPGTYSVTVKDASCPPFVLSGTVTITSQGISTTTASVGAGCGLSNGSATVNVTGGAAPYTYLWNPGAQSGATASGLAAGSYTVTVTDAGGCSQTSVVNVTSATSASVSFTSQNVLCSGGNSGYATANMAVGTPP
jgi:hypothetical protein